MTALAQLTPHAVVEGRARTGVLVADQVGYALRELWRSRIVLIFTFVLPLVWLVLIGTIAGNETLDEATGVRIMQFVTPAAAVMGLLFSAYPPVANSLAQARERKVTKRFAGTPLPTWIFLMGRVGAAVILAAVAVVVMLAVGVLAYGVQIQWNTALASTVTLAVGVACLASLGLAVGAVAPSASTAQSFAFATAVVLSFISGLFVMGTLPSWLDTLGSVFPVRQLMTPLRVQFNPFLEGSGWDLSALAVMAAWGVVGLAVAAWGLRRETTSAMAAPTSAPVSAGAGLRATAPGRLGPATLALDQARWASTTLMRDAGNVFFAIVMPAGLYALMCSMYADSDLRPNGTPFAFWFAMGMAAYGAGVSAFINMPESVVTARDRGVLKRLRGTPLAPWQYLAGRTTAAVWISFLTAVLVFVVGIAFFGLKLGLGAEGILLGTAVMLLGTLTIAACGYALVALAPSAKAMAVIALGILLPLSFFSDIFMVGSIPEWMGQFGAIFPLRHLVYGLAAVLDPAGPTVPWTDLAVMTAWLVGASLVAVRRFRWEPTR